MARRRDPFDAAVEKAHSGKHWRRPEAAAVLEKLQDSGLTIADFIREHGLPEKRVRWWRKRLGGVSTRQVDPPQFVALQVVEAEDCDVQVEQRPWVPAIQGTSSLEVVLHNGRVVRVPVGFDLKTLSQVVEVLEVTPC
jgi:hypothetical protein